MPVRNAATFLTECIESIVNQTFKEWELIAINDHSTDQSKTLLTQFAEKDKRINVLDNKGEGIIHALSLAFENSKYNFITRMDADDIMHREKLQCLFEAINGKTGAVATAKVEYFAEGGIGDGYRKYQNWLNDLIDTNTHYKHIYKECVIPSPCWMTSREVLDKIEGFKNLEYPEDYDLCFKFYTHAIQVVPVNKILHYWRDYSSRTSRNDPNYADNTFIHLKVKHFLNVDYRSDIPLKLWGAGKKGKIIAQLLDQKGVPFRWYTNNPNKIGHTISNTELEDVVHLDKKENQQVIFAIAQLETESLQEGFNELAKVYAFC